MNVTRHKRHKHKFRSRKMKNRKKHTKLKKSAKNKNGFISNPTYCLNKVFG